MKKKYLLMLCLFILLLEILGMNLAFAYNPDPDSPLGKKEHPRLLITKENIPTIKSSILADSVLKQRYQEYVNWAAQQTTGSKENYINIAGHNIMAPPMISQALIAAIGPVDGITFPTGWDSQKYARTAFDTFKTRLDEGQELGFAAPLVYDWTYNYIFDNERKSAAQIMASRNIVHKLFSNYNLNNPQITPAEMFSSKYYECMNAYFIGLALWGDGYVDSQANTAVDTFYDDMINYGYLDAMEFTGAEGGWNEWVGYASWHPKNHMVNIDVWRTATGESYISSKNIKVQGKVANNQLKLYPYLLHYAMDSHRYVNEPNSPDKYDTYTFVRTGSASTTDTALTHDEKIMELRFLPGILYEEGLTTQAGLVRDFIERYNVKFINYQQHWPFAFLGAAGSTKKVSPTEIGMKKYLWAKNQGTFFARTGFTDRADGVFTVNDAHFRFNGHYGADDFPGFSLNKYGDLVNSRYVAHRGYGNLEEYEGAFRDNVIDYGVSEKYKEVNTAADLKSVLTGASGYDLGGIEQTTVNENIFYHVRVDRSRLYSGITHNREYVWLPGSNPSNDADFLIIYDRSESSSQEPKWNYHVPWQPDAYNYDSVTDMKLGSGLTGRIGTKYSGSNIIIKELNGKGDEYDSDGGTASYVGGSQAHGVLFAKVLLPQKTNVEVTRIAEFNSEVFKRQANLAIKSHRWQVTVRSSDNSAGSKRFLNVMETGEETKHTSMVATSLLQTGTFDGSVIARQSSTQPNYAILFNKDKGVYTGSISYSLSQYGISGNTRNIIVGLDPAKSYTVRAGSQSFDVNPIGDSDLWSYKDGGKVTKVGVIYFESSATEYTITEKGTVAQTCSDGTIYGQCSSSKPNYCDSGTLVKRCSSCSCQTDYTCQADGTCVQQNVPPLCTPTNEICGNGIDEDCDGKDSICPPVVCGNGIVESVEQCDTSNLNGKTCINLGYAGGTLKCTSDCTFDMTGCTVAQNETQNQTQNQTTSSVLYVNNKAVNCNNNGAGTKEQPLCSIANGISKLKAGYTLYVRGSTDSNNPQVYSEALSINLAGTEDAGILISTYSGEYVQLEHPSSVILSFADAAKYLTVKGFIIDRKDVNAYAISLKGSYNTLDSLRIYNGVKDLVDVSSKAVDVSIKNSEIHDVYLAGGTDAHCILVNTGAKNFKVSGSKIYNCDGDGIQFYAGSDLSSTYSSRGIIENNVFYNTQGYPDEANGVVENALDLKGVNDLVIRNNEIYNFPNKAIVVQKGCSRITLENNNIHDVELGLEFRGEEGYSQSGHIIKRNRIVRVNDPSYSEYCLKFDDVSNVKIYHNTLVSCGTYAIRIEEEGLLNSEIKNNVIYNSGSASNTGTFSDNTVRNNAWYNSGYGAMSSIFKDSSDQQGSGNPGFTDPTKDNYQPTQNSPLVDAGTNIGESYKGTAPDIGYYESPYTKSTGNTNNTNNTNTECTPGIIRSCTTGSFGVCSSGTQECSSIGVWYSCQMINAPDIEICNNNLDDNCDGNIDEDCATLPVCDCVNYQCNPSNNGMKCDGCFYVTAPKETCNNNADDDCDGLKDSADTVDCAAIVCTSGQVQTCNTGKQGICADGKQTCSNNALGLCSQSNQPATEICGNGIDENCDGYDKACSACGDGLITDNEECDSNNLNGKSCASFGTEYVGGVLSCTPECRYDLSKCNKHAAECVYEQVQNCDTGLKGVCSSGTKSCTSLGAWSACKQTYTMKKEACNNNLDDDCDGSVDEGCGSLNVSTSNKCCLGKYCSTWLCKFVKQ